MSMYMIDVEADGPCPNDYSMIAFAAVKVEPGLKTTFCRIPIKPVSPFYNQEALAVSGLTRDECFGGSEAGEVMVEFTKWVKATNTYKTPQFWSDCGFDWCYMNYYLWHFCDENPFGHSPRNLSDLYKGLRGDMRASFKHLRQTPHDHNPLNDAMGNAEALLAVLAMYSLTPRRF